MNREKKKMMKIWYQNPVPLLDEFQGLGRLLEQTTKKMGREGTQVDIKWLEEGAPDPTFSFTMALNALSQARMIREAREQGYDAAVIGNSIDIGLREARSVVRFPVAGAAESALYVAASLGNRFSIVCVNHKIAQFMDNLVKIYGMGGRIAVIADLGISLSEVAAVYRDPERLMSLFRDRAIKTIEENGAEAVVVGCTILSTLLTVNQVHEIDGTPLVDPVWAGIKMAEVFADMQRDFGVRVCRSSIYGTCPQEDLRP